MNPVVANKYRLDGVIGSGTFGTVFRAEHTTIGRTVAVKVLEIPPEMENRADSVRSRFLREARILGKLDHVNTVQVFDFGEYEGKPYLVMEFLEGRTLHQKIKRGGPMPEAEVTRITQQILAGLSRAHDLGLVHRDLKPANVMLVPSDDGGEDVKLLDFGVATAYRDDGLKDARDLSVTVKGTFVGTPPYAAPEQFTGESNAASDVYAVGLLMWEMLMGRQACPHRDVGACARLHLDPAPWELPEGMPATKHLKAVVRRSLAKNPGERYADAGAMLGDLGAMTQAITDEQLVDALQADSNLGAPAKRDNQPGDLLVGKYRLKKIIGRGGFSRVFEAEHVDMERRVAVKILDLAGAVAHSGNTTADDLRRRFGREAKMSSQLAHPNTITVYDFGVDEDGRWYLVMEFIEGTNLHAAVRRQGKFEARRAATIGAKILRSLSEAHHLGVLHRDLKPGNIMIAKDFKGDETVKVLDFGIATVHNVDGGLGMQPTKATQMGMFVGTPQYAAPEQFMGEKLTPSTDIYAVGLVLWEMLTGEAAITANAFGACLQKHLSGEDWELPPEAQVPRGLADILYGALQKDPSRRYLSAAEMADDLEAWLDGEREEFQPAPVTEERWNPKFEYKSTEQAIIDPNLAEDALPEFLATPKPAAERSGDLPSAPKRKPKKGGLPKPRPQKKLELDLDQAKPVRRDRIVRPSAAAPEPRRLPSLPIPMSTIAVVVGLAIVAGIGYSVVQSDGEAEAEVDLINSEPMYMNLDDPGAEKKSEIGNNEFSASGIIQALEQAGWLVKRTQRGNSLTSVHQQGYRLSRSGKTIEIELVTTKNTSIAMEMFQDTRPPIQAVLFDNKLVRIFPPRGKEDPAMMEIMALLKRYRDLVREGKEVQ